MASQTAPSKLSPAARQAIALALSLLERRDFETAAELHRRVAADFPDEPEVAYLEAELAVAAGDIERACRAIDRATVGNAPALSLLMRRADILALAKQRSAALAAVSQAAALATTQPASLWALGRIRSRCGDSTGARDLYQAAASAGLGDPALLYDLGVSQFFSGDSAAAESTFDRLLERQPKLGHAAYIRATARRQTAERNHVDDLRSALDSLTLDTENRAAYLYALAKELEDLGDDTESAAALIDGARLKRQTLTHDAAAEREAIRSIGETFTSDVLGGIRAGDGGEGVIFIVGMPRTGTTLLEHLLARHAGVRSAGELPDFGDALADSVRARLQGDAGVTPVEAARHIDFAELSRRYLDTARQAAAGAPRFVDKMPINFMYCGLIAKALPQARIVHLVRDPMDTCYAVFKTLFANAYPFSYEQEELAEYFLTYHYTMSRWHAALPGAILDVRYEELVRDPDAELQRVLQWCGLPWQPASEDAELSRASMTASAAQVRQPIHTGSIGKWKLYAQVLEPMRRRLEAGGIAIG